MPATSNGPRGTARTVIYTRQRLAFFILLVLGVWSVIATTYAHEHKHTHRNLTRAVFRFLDSPYLMDNPDRFDGLTAQDIEDELTQGVIDEDECLESDDTGGNHDWGKLPFWNSHFYEAKQGTRLSILVAPGAPGCRVFDSGFTNAAYRAHTLYTMAIDDFRARKFRSAFRILGRVLHLLEDMTSPAHAHDDPHLELGGTCGHDADDFERWGYCEGLADEGDPSTHICDYFDSQAEDSGTCRTLGVRQRCHVDFDSDGVDEDYGIPPVGFKCRLWAALQILYDGGPQGNRKSGDPVVVRPSERSLGEAFVRHVANITYDFTTFRVHLKDDTVFIDPQSSSELRAMLRGNKVEDCNNLSFNDKGLCELEKLGNNPSQWHIRGNFQDIGRTFGRAGKVDRAWPDAREEWWIMPTGYRLVTRARLFGGADRFISGWAYVENAGGEGPAGFGRPRDNFIPWRYGCTVNDFRLCGDTTQRTSKSKLLYQRLYGTNDNDEDPIEPVEHVGKTLLRIYGDVLYPTAVAYGAGLIQAFIDDIEQPPVADAGGPYGAPACSLIEFNADSSHAVKGRITSYEWDFTDDGTFDAVTDNVIYPYAYPGPFNGRARLRVTDEDGATDEDTTFIEVWDDTTAPTITRLRATPRRLLEVDGRLKRVTITPVVDDPCGPGLCKIVRVTSPDPSASSQDWRIVDDLTVRLRAEVGATGRRRYDIVVECTDAAGNTSARVVRVQVQTED